MSFVLVLTVASLALAEAGYQYNALSESFGLPGNQPANFQPRHGSQQQIILPNEFDQPISNILSYKDYVYLKQINNGNHVTVNHASNSGFVAGPTVQAITGQSANGGYVNAGYAQSFAHHAPTANLNNNYAHNYPHVNSHFNSGQIQHFAPVTSTSGNTNTGYTQSISLSGSNSNVGSVHNSILSTAGPSAGYAQTSSASAVNINNGYAHTSVPAASNNFNVGNVQTFIPSTNLNSGYSYAPAPNANTGLSHGYANSAIHSTGSNVNTGYSQTTGSESYSNGYSTSSASSTLNTGHSKILAPSGTASFSNSYAQSSIPLTNVNPINSYSQPVAVSGSVGLNHGYPQASVSSASGNLNNGYSQTQAPYSSSSSTNNGYAQISTESASDNSNNDYSYRLVPYSNSYSTSHTNAQTSAGTDTNLNTGYSQILSPIVSSSSNTGYSETSIPLAVDGINNYNTGFSHSLSSGTGSASHGFANNVVPAGPALNTGYSQTTDSNLNTGSSQSFSSDGGSFNSGYSQTALPQIDAQLNTAYGTPVSSSLSNSYSEISNSPLKVNLNPISTLDTINSGSVQKSTGSSNLNIAFTQTGSSNNFNGKSVGGFSSAAIAPAVYKHIYVHVPPPDIEEQNVVPPPSPLKKNYRIIFIKVPSQEPRTNLARINQIAENINAASSIEHKTLIYVLVKNPETQQPVVIPNQTPSEHEVFFVKYNGDPIDIAAQVNDELDKTGAVQSIVPLEQGLVHGKK